MTFIFTRKGKINMTLIKEKVIEVIDFFSGLGIEPTNTASTKKSRKKTPVNAENQVTMLDFLSQKTEDSQDNTINTANGAQPLNAPTKAKSLLESMFGAKLSTKKEITISDIIAREKQSPSPKEELTKSSSAKAHDNNFQITNKTEAKVGLKTKFQNMLTAIKTLFKLEEEDRTATPEEKDILAEYNGFGNLKAVFNPTPTKQWEKEQAELKNILSKEEYQSLSASCLNAHYTASEVVEAMYRIALRLGFNGGKVLEPACGSGKFFGLVPKELSGKVKFTGVELENITGRLTRMLYPKVDIRVQGFEEALLQDNYYDLAISNVPFGDYGVFDKKYNHIAGLNIHDYFFLKALDKVREDGLVMFITSKGTLDKAESKVRKMIAERAELIGAIRLPNTAFMISAGTEVTTDIIILRKYRQGEVPKGHSFIGLQLLEKGVPVNEYYYNNPHMLLGTMVYDKSMYGSNNETALEPNENEPLIESLNKAIETLPKGIYRPADIVLEAVNAAIDYFEQPDQETVKENSYCIVSGKVYQRKGLKLEPIKQAGKTFDVVYNLTKIKDQMHKVFNIQLQGCSDEALKVQQKKLNTLYDSFYWRYGYINDNSIKRLYGEDPEYFLLCSLEIPKGKKFIKADIFSKRTLDPNKTAEYAESAEEALIICMNELGYLNINRITQLTSKSKEFVIDELKGKIFKNPETLEYEIKDEYLTGNVRAKLYAAKKAVEQYGDEYLDNVKALESVKPKDLTYDEIDVSLGSTWVPGDIIKDFICHILKISEQQKEGVEVTYVKQISVWAFKIDAFIDRSQNNIKWGTERIDAVDIIKESLNLRQVKIFDAVERDGRETYVLNKKDTMIARQKQDEIKDAFKKWVYEDIDRRSRLEKIYNDLYNSLVVRKYDGSNLKLHGANKEITLRPHQLNAIARGIYGRNTLLAHCVGAGKTYVLTAIGMELKRLGLVKKPMYVVPNNLVESGQFAGELLKLYPNANILVATKKDFESTNRKKFVARIATGQWDCIIIGHSSFKLIPVSKELEESFITNEIYKIEEAIQEEAEKSGRRRTAVTVELEKAKKRWDVKLRKLLDSKKDDTIIFEKLGVDMLLVDESHNFKNLGMFTKLSRIAGVNTTSSQKTEDMFMKLKYVQSLHNGRRGGCFASGTPVSNSMVELYTVQKYLQFSLLEEFGLENFDAWAANFGKVVTSIEIDPTGQNYRAKERFSQFVNVPELMNMFRYVADIQTEDMLNLPKPQLDGGYTIVENTPSEFTQEYIKTLLERAERVKSKQVDKSEDNMLNITNDGRAVALDPRLIDPTATDVPGSKINQCVENVYKEYVQGSAEKLTQLIFCDLGTPKKNKGKLSEEEMSKLTQAEILDRFTFCVYDDVKEKLIKKGIPENEIAYIHDATTSLKRKELFKAMRSGEKRILIGSTQKMGEGMNIQDLVICLHHLDVPWRPSDISQREGRILRQGNVNEVVRIYRYCTKGTFDSYSWQIIETKAKFIAQIMKGETTARTMEELDEAILSFAQMKAAASGNPLILRKFEVDSEVHRLQALESAHDRRRYSIQYNIRESEDRVIQLEKVIPQIEKDAELVAKYNFEKFSIKITEALFDERKAAGEKLLELASLVEKDTEVSIGEFAGFHLCIQRKPCQTSGYSYDPTIIIKGERDYVVAISESDYGTIVKIENAIKNISNILKDRKESKEHLSKEIEGFKQEIDQPFELKKQLHELLSLQREINNKLCLNVQDDVLDDSLEETA